MTVITVNLKSGENTYAIPRSKKREKAPGARFELARACRNRLRRIVTPSTLNLAGSTPASPYHGLEPVNERNGGLRSRRAARPEKV